MKKFFAILISVLTTLLFITGCTSAPPEECDKAVESAKIRLISCSRATLSSIKIQKGQVSITCEGDCPCIFPTRDEVNFDAASTLASSEAAPLERGVTSSDPIQSGVFGKDCFIPEPEPQNDGDGDDSNDDDDNDRDSLRDDCGRDLPGGIVHLDDGPNPTGHEPDLKFNFISTIGSSVSQVMNHVMISRHKADFATLEKMYSNLRTQGSKDFFVVKAPNGYRTVIHRTDVPGVVLRIGSFDQNRLSGAVGSIEMPGRTAAGDGQIQR